MMAALLLSNKIMQAQVSANDSLVLVDLNDSTGGPGWKNHTNWLTTQPLKTWYGIKLNYY